MSRAVGLLLFCSGAAALVHQVAWVRLLGFGLGATSVATATVLTAFFGGMAAGAAAAGRLARGGRADLERVARLELAVGIAGLLLLLVLPRVDALLALGPGLGSALPARFALCAALLCVPTFCMGAVLPLVAGVATAPREHALPRRLAGLYAANTAGAVVGALAAGFLLVPALGLAGAVGVASAANFAAAFCAQRAARGTGAEQPAPPAAPAGNDRAPQRTPARIVLFATGAAAIGLEVGWTKLLAIFLGATLYGFSALLAIFLFGLAAGSWAARSRWVAHARPEVWLAAGLPTLAGLVLLSRSALTRLPDVTDALSGAAPLFETSLWLRCALAVPVLLPPAFVFGALFPLSLALYCGDAPDVARRSGRGIALNTVAGVVGSIAAGLWVIPRWGSDVLLVGAALGLAVASLALWGTLASRGRALALGAVACVTGFAYTGPPLDFHPLLSAVRYRVEDRGRPAPDYLFVAEGRAAVVSVSSHDGVRARLESNGIQESWWEIGAPDRRPRVELLLGLAPAVLHPAARSAFVVGYGAGHSVAALRWTPLERIRVVELEPAVVDALRRGGGDVSPLSDPRVEIVFNDARNALIVEGDRYDLVVSQPSHPWLAGAGNLFTREFFDIVASRLEPGGIHAQWLNLFQMDEATLASILRAFFDVYEHGLSLADASSSDLILIGSEVPIAIDYERIGARMRKREATRTLANAGFRDPYDLLRFFALSRREALRAAGSASPNRDLRLLTESRLALGGPERADPGRALRMLSAQFGLDLEPFFPSADLPRRYYEAGRFLAARGATQQARRALEALRGIDPALASALERDAF